MTRTTAWMMAGIMMAGWAAAQPPIRFISHRGESADAPENTMAAFRLAVERQTGGFECDVYLTADNEIVCMHDTTTARTTDGNLTVASSTLAQLQQLDAGSWKGAKYAGERIPTLSEALTLAQDGLEIYVEIKGGANMVPRLKEVIEAEPKATPERVVLISFQSAVISAVRQQLPAYRAYLVASSSNVDGVLSPSVAQAIANLQACGASGLDLQANGLIDANYVQAIQNAGYSFHVWTVNDIQTAASLAAMGVDSITTDKGMYLSSILNGVPAVSLPTPVIHYSFDDGTATNLGSGGGAYNGTLHGSPAFTNGMGGSALVLDGVDDVVACSYQLPEQGAVALWYRPDFFYNYNEIFDNAVHSEWWEMWIYDDGRLRFRVHKDDASGVGYDLDNLNGSNHWYHVVVTWSLPAAETALYINGMRRATGVISQWVTPGTTFYIGGGHSGNHKGRGLVDDVRIYDVALTEEQVWALHAELGEQTPMVHIDFNESSTNIGAGGPRYDATLNGEPAWTNGLNDRWMALALDGEDDVVAIPYKLNQAGTVSLWYYAPGPWYNYNSIFDNSSGGDNYECWIDGSGALNFRTGRPEKIASSLGSGSNRWYHIVCTWHTASLTTVLYVNGQERRRLVDTNNWPNAGNWFYIGGGHSGNTKARGAVADFRLYDAPMSSNRVAELFWDMRRRQGGLKAYVPFDGTAEDVVGSHAVVLSGSPTFVKSQGGFYKGLSCAGPGSQDYVSISNVLGSKVGTIALWYYARPWYDYQTLFDNAVHADYWECWINTSGQLGVRVTSKTGGGDRRYDLDNLRGPNNWYHIAYVWDFGIGEALLYVDGVLRGTAVTHSSAWVDPDPTLCLSGTRNTQGNGIWDEVRVYDRVLMAEEVAALAVVPPAPPPTGTLISVR